MSGKRKIARTAGNEKKKDKNVAARRNWAETEETGEKQIQIRVAGAGGPAPSTT